jgi:transposase
MLRPNSPDLKAYLHRAPIDMRAGRNRLASLVREVIQQDPFQPAFFIFTNKRFDAIKLLVWDMYGNRLIMGWSCAVGHFHAVDQAVFLTRFP